MSDTLQQPTYKLVARVWAFMLYAPDEVGKGGKWEYKQGFSVDLGGQRTFTRDIDRDIELWMQYQVEDTEDVAVETVKVDYWKIFALPVSEEG